MAVLTPIKAIRAKCIDCCCGQRLEVKLCTCPDCPLYPYRLGHRPKGDQIPDENHEDEKGGASRAFEGKSDNDNDNEDGTPRYSSYNRTSTLNSAAESDFFDEDDEILDEEDADTNEDEKRNLNEEVTNSNEGV